MTAPRRILVRLPNWVGDVVMATPALRALRTAHPRAEIVVEGRGFLAGLLAGLPSIDRFVPAGPGGWRDLPRLRRELSALACDWAVLLPDSVRAAVGPFLARIPRRAGYARDALRRALLTDALDVPRDAAGRRVPIPMTERYLAITRALGCADAGAHVELVVSAGPDAAVAARLAALGVTGPFAVVSPGANFGSSKLYPPEQFAAACDLVQRRHGLAPVLAPGPGEEALADRIAGAMTTRAIVLRDPVTNLAELVALVARAALLLTNDTGPRHVAVAVGTPAVVVMGPTDPRHTAYQLERQRVLREQVECSPCHLKTCPIDHRCMTRLPPERLADAAGELLAAHAAGAVDASDTAGAASAPGAAEAADAAGATNAAGAAPR